MYKIGLGEFKDLYNFCHHGLKAFLEHASCLLSIAY